MAENAAHITSSLQVRPSIFEVIAQESLNELLYPSLKIFIQFLGSSYPLQCNWLNEWFEEVFLAVNGLLQLHYLNSRDASFSESFYGLRRVFLEENKNRLSANARYWSVFCLVGLPYLAQKMKHYLTTYKVEANVGHMMLLAAWRTTSLVHYMLYLTGRARAHSLLLSAFDLSLQYIPEQLHPIHSLNGSFLSPGVFLKLLTYNFTQSLELIAFFLQCLQWWYSDEHRHHKMANLVPPPPPQGDHLDEPSLAVCPVCKTHCKIETALQTSGYVFCYRCIQEAIVTTHKCPVTGLPTTLNELVRLFPSK